MTHDLKFHNSNTYVHDDKNVLAGIKTESIKPSVESFLANIRRLKILHELPSEVGYLHSAFLVAVVGDVFAKTPKRESESKEERENRLFIEHLHDKGSVKDPDEVKLFDRVFALAGKTLIPGMESILSAEITGAWTAFEVLAGDLWESALNCRPLVLATLAANRTAKVTDDKSQSSSSVQLNLLAKYKFDIRDKMGTVLREKLSFAVLDKIRQSYRRAFDDPTIRSIIDGETTPDPLNTLSFVRNVIVHRAGIADEDFRTRADGHPTFGTIEEGEKVNIDGDIVHTIVSESIKRSLSLITAVDDWLDKNP